MQITQSGYRLGLMCCCVLLLAKGAGVSSVEQRSVHVGGKVKVFSNTGGRCKDVSIYGKNKTYIAHWHFEDYEPEIKYMNPDYNAKMDRNGDVWFLNVEKKDSGYYDVRCEPPLEQHNVELIVSDEKITPRLDDKPEVIMKYLDNLTEEVKMIRERFDNQEVIMKPLENLTEEVKKITKRLDNHEDIVKTLGGSHSETYKINAILGILILLLIIMIVRLAYYMRNQNQHKTSKKKLTDEQTRELVEKYQSVFLMFVEKNIEKLTDDQMREQMLKFFGARLMVMGKNLDQPERTGVCHTSSSQESTTIHPADFSVEERCLENEPGVEDNQNKGISKTTDVDMISLLGKMSSSHGQPERLERPAHLP